MSDRDTMTLPARILPSRLGSRVVLTILLTGLVVLAIAAVGVLLAANAVRPIYEDDSARNALSLVDQGVGQQGTALFTSTAPLGTATRMRDAALTGDLPSDLSDTLDAYARQIGASAVVLLDAEGTRVYSFGEAGDTAAIEALLLRGTEPTWKSGPLDLQNTPSVIALRDVTGADPHSPVVGLLVVAAPLEVDPISLDGRLTFEDPESTSRLPGASRILQDSRFRDALITPIDSGFRLEAEIPGVDERAAATIVYTDSISLRSLGNVFGQYAAVVVLIAGVIGLASGVFMARAIARPINELSDHMVERSADSIAGRDVGTIPIDPLLPEELSHLINAFNRIFNDLRQHQAELALAKEQAVDSQISLDIAVQDSLEGKILIRDGVITVFNPAAASHLAVKPGTALGQPAARAFSAGIFTDTHDEALDPDDLVEAAIHRSHTVKLDRDKHAPRWLEIKTVQHSRGSETMLITTRDVTESRRVDELRTEIVGLVSHDLRAPLTVISGYLDLMTRGLDDDARSKAVASAQRSALRMQELLEDLLAATRAEEMFAPIELAAVDLREVAQDTVSSFEHTSPHELRFEAACSAVVLGEERRLRQVVVNLLTNAMKYSPPDRGVYVSVLCDGQTAMLVVEDEGSGVPHDMREAIFERFARLESETGAMNPGVGLGLYIVRAIVESHGGRVFVEDRAAGPGARFVVSLPLAPDAQTAEKA